jgi:hypothetical protein
MLAFLAALPISESILTSISVALSVFLLEEEKHRKT